MIDVVLGWTLDFVSKGVKDTFHIHHLGKKMEDQLEQKESLIWMLEWEWKRSLM